MLSFLLRQLAVPDCRDSRHLHMRKHTVSRGPPYAEVMAVCQLGQHTYAVQLQHKQNI